jgi:hypothetical protein
MALDHRSYDGKSARIGKLIRLLGSDKSRRHSPNRQG